MQKKEDVHVKVSIITVVRNAVSKIEPTLLSVFTQNYDNIEYIVIDGDSTDGTVDVINRHKNQISILISEPDEGIYDAFNKGVMLATGEWIAIMNAGDVFVDNDVLAKIFATKHYNDVDILYGDAISVDNGFESYEKSSDLLSDFVRHPVYRQGASFIRRAVHRNFLFDLSKARQLEFALDYEQMYRMYVGGCRFKRVPFAILKYELRGVSTVSPFKITRYNYLITHDMRCGFCMKIVLAWLTLWRGGCAVLKRMAARLGAVGR